MTGDLARGSRLLVLPTIGLLVVLVFFPGRASLAVRVYALVVCGVALALVVGALRRAYPPASPLRPPKKSRTRRPDVPAQLSRLEQEALLGVAGSFDLHHRLRPRLRELASELLHARRGIALDERPEQARTVLGEETWELVRPHRPPPEDRLARGLPVAELSRVVESLERI